MTLSVSSRMICILTLQIHNDALIAHGIIPPRPKTPPSPDPPPQAALDEPDIGSDDELLNEDDLPRSVLEAYRTARLQELRDTNARNKFGRIFPIQKVDYTREINEASQEGDDERGTGVVCFLYKDSVLESRLLGAHLARLAELYPSTKFVSIVGDMCIENYPDRNIPTLLIYRAGELVHQVVGLSPVNGLRGQKTTLSDVENLLIDATAVEADRRTVPRESSRASDDEADGDDDVPVRRIRG